MWLESRSLWIFCSWIFFRCWNFSVCVSSCFLKVYLFLDWKVHNVYWHDNTGCGQHIIQCFLSLLWIHKAVPLHSLQYLRSLLCIHMAEPPHCLQKARALLCKQMFFPLQSLHWFVCLSCMQMLAPLHYMHELLWRLLCGHVFLYVWIFLVVMSVDVGNMCVMHIVGNRCLNGF